MIKYLYIYETNSAKTTIFKINNPSKKKTKRIKGCMSQGLVIRD
jgi:hypothetical protein